MTKPTRIWTLKPRTAWHQPYCHECGYIFEIGDKLVSKIAAARSTVKHYCIPCAKRLNII